MNKFSHKGTEKKTLVTKLFNDIAKSYDFFNHFFSFGIDYYWRSRLVKKANISNEDIILDVATGTGDVAFNIASRAKHVTGLDIASEMIKIANQKKSKKRFDNIDFLVGDGEKLPFEDKSFDIITISFGFRNIADQQKALQEFNRVLKDNGKLLILEFSQPKSKFFGMFYRFYSYKVMPAIASLITKKYAYEYLPESIDMFSTRSEIKNKLEESNFKDLEIIDMTFGISTIFTGSKNASK
jgi:demethylmenaquinone methyltransferase/2-methoxy-6-polyprenyl-1,4-benzoquinol methylase